MRIRLKQTVNFVDRSSLALTQPSLVVHASNETQNVPDWLQDTPEFDLLEDSGHLEVISSPTSTKRAPTSADLGGATGIAGSGIPQGSEADPTKEGHETNAKLLEHSNAENERLRAQIADLEAKAVRDTARGWDSSDKSSGQDGEAGDWTTAGRDVAGYPVPKGSPLDTTATPADKAKFTKAQNAASKG